MSFTRESYRILLGHALTRGYEFLSFDDPARHTHPLVCLLRHDIDIDLGAAVHIAEMEASLGIRSTYFLMLRSPLYNLFSKDNHELVERLLELNHWVGLHFNENIRSMSDEVLKEQVLLEAEILSKAFGVNIKSVSFHQPSQRILNGDIAIPGLVNTYHHDDLRGFHYCSDSNRQWRGDPAETLLMEQRHPKLHLLLHPIWWDHDEDLAREAVWNIGIKANWQRCQEELLATVKGYGPPREIRLDYHSSM